MFLTFEGIDGSGKTTLAREVARQLGARGLQVTMIEKRSSNFGGPYFDSHMHALRAVLWDYPRDAPVAGLGDRHWLHLQAAWFSAMATRQVEPALAERRMVIVDNWYFKLLARFGVKGIEQGREAEDCFARVLRPDLVFFLDVSPELALARKGQVTPAECGVFEGFQGEAPMRFVAYQSRVHEQMKAMSRALGWIRLASGPTPSELAEQCLSTLRLHPLQGAL